MVEKAFVEADVEGGPYDVSDADTMLAYLNKGAVMAPNVTIFTRPGCGRCGRCVRAKGNLAERGIDFEEVVPEDGLTSRSLRAVAGAEAVPQFFIDGELIGGQQSWLRIWAPKSWLCGTYPGWTLGCAGGLSRKGSG